MNNTLSKDGFYCTFEHALGVAQMISNMESAWLWEPNYKREVLELLGEYFRGNLDEDDVNNILYTEWSEAFPGLDRKEPSVKQDQWGYSE